MLITPPAFPLWARRGEGLLYRPTRASDYVFCVGVWRWEIFILRLFDEGESRQLFGVRKDVSVKAGGRAYVDTHERPRVLRVGH